MDLSDGEVPRKPPAGVRSYSTFFVATFFLAIIAITVIILVVDWTRPGVIGCPPTYFYEGIEATLVYEGMENNNSRLYPFFNNNSTEQHLDLWSYDYYLIRNDPNGPGPYVFKIVETTNNTTTELARGRIYPYESPLTVHLSMSSISNNLSQIESTSYLSELKGNANRVNLTFEKDKKAFMPILDIFTSVFNPEFGEPTQIIIDVGYSGMYC